MDFINPIQLIIIAVIIALLIVQKIAFKKGKFEEVHYSANRRLSVAISIASTALMCVLLTNQLFLGLLGIVMAVICYRRKIWYRFKSS